MRSPGVSKVRQKPQSYIPIVLTGAGAIFGIMGFGIGYYAVKAVPVYPEALFVSEYEAAVLTSLLGIQKVGIALAIGVFLVAAAFCLTVAAILAHVTRGRPIGCNLHAVCDSCGSGL
jgi:hypothetical protein